MIPAFKERACKNVGIYNRNVAKGSKCCAIEMKNEIKIVRNSTR